MSAETSETTPAQEPVGENPKEGPSTERTAFLEEELRVRTDERENYKNRMKQMEQELEAMQKIVAEIAGPSVDKPATENTNKSDSEENAKLRAMVTNLKESLREKTSAYSRKQLETEALESQVAALKEVTLLTKGMLDIRNTENVQLKEQIDLMQQNIVAERLRHNSMLQKTEQASSINNQLKEEYHKQVALFGDLKEKYERKVFLLQEEIGRLEALQGTPSAT